ncbi:MAG: hypothetical protein M0P71_00915 [Melioribacteraceae bacterium]|nr:hypothetical protein [Melioribacteraceae bacterium]
MKKNNGGNRGNNKGIKENIRKKYSKRKVSDKRKLLKIEPVIIKNKIYKEEIPHLKSPSTIAKLLVDKYTGV